VTHLTPAAHGRITNHLTRATAGDAAATTVRVSLATGATDVLSTAVPLLSPGKPTSGLLGRERCGE
jgi:hypothetical protein